MQIKLFNIYENIFNEYFFFEIKFYNGNWLDEWMHSTA
jgi:hypothetical protein